MAVRTALEALAMRPTRFLRSSWPWRSVLYLAASTVLGSTTIAVAALMLSDGASVWVFVVWACAFALIVVGCVPVARLERWWLRLVDRAPIDDPHRPLDRPGWRGWLRVRLREQVTGRELGYAIVSGAVLCWMDAILVIFTVGFPVMFLFTPLNAPADPQSYLLAAIGVALVIASAYPVTAWAGARAAMARAILAPRDGDDLGERLVEVTRSRARLVDAFEIERRRIERDLHDGAQQRLVALTMQLGLARLELPPDSPAAEPLSRAHDLARQALTELRELIRGVHPKILTDRGLAAAVRDVAGRSPVPVDVDIRLPRRPAEPVETAAYFAVVEALANVAKHSGASRAAVTSSVDGDRLLVEVRDNGVGGADPSAGSGLAGLADRVAAVDGTFSISSPAGGPTVLRVEFAGGPTVLRVDSAGGPPVDSAGGPTVLRVDSAGGPPVDSAGGVAR